MKHRRRPTRGQPGSKRRQSECSNGFLTGKELDPDFVDFNSVNRRYHFPARFYLPLGGVFGQIDRLYLVNPGGIKGQGVYSYVAWRNTEFVDPTGLYVDLSGCSESNIERIQTWLYDPNVVPTKNFSEAMKGAKGLAIRLAHGKPDDLFELALKTGTGIGTGCQSKCGCCKCIDVFNVTMHRGAGVGAISGDLTWGADPARGNLHTPPDVITFIPLGTAGDPRRKRKKNRNYMEGSIWGMGEQLGKFACNPCVINIYGCAFAEGDEGVSAMLEMAMASGCTVFAADVSVWVGAEGWALEGEGTIESVSPHLDHRRYPSSPPTKQQVDSGTRKFSQKPLHTQVRERWYP